MDQNKIWGATGFNLGPLLFLVYIIDLLPKAREHEAIPILFADDTSILITSPSNIQFQSDLNVVFRQLNKWFKGSLLSLNFDKTYFIQFINKSTRTCDIRIMYEDKFVQLLKRNFLGYLLIIVFIGKHEVDLNLPGWKGLEEEDWNDRSIWRKKII